MNPKFFIPLTLALLASICAPAYASSLKQYECEICDSVGVLDPKPILSSVNPDPLPIKEVGASQNVTVTWSMPHSARPMLKQRYALCVTGSDPIVRLKDGCIDLQNTTTTMAGEDGTHYQSHITLPGTFQRFRAYFYIRMQPIIVIGAGGFTASNLLPFQWPLHIAELEARSVKVDFGVYGDVYAEQRVTNRGTRASSGFQNRYHMTVCSQIIDPARACTTGSAEYLDTLVVFGQSGGIQAGATENVHVNITSLLPSNPATLTITIRGDVDYFNDVRESDEFNNGDTGTDTLFR